MQLAGFRDATILGATPDGSFRVIALRTGIGTLEIQLFRLDTAGGAEPLGPVIAEGNGLSSDSFALDDTGATWIPFYSDADEAFELAIVAGDGSSTTLALPRVGAERWSARRTYFGVRLVATGGSGYALEPRRGTFKLEVGGGFVPAEPYPVEFSDGRFWFSPSAERASWDAGAHWSETTGFPDVVPRVPGLPRFLVTRDAIAERYSSFLYRNVRLAFPEGVSPYSIIDAGGAVVAAGKDTIYVHQLPLPPLQTEVGQLPADARSLVLRADQFRADAGLPPLTGDALISQASHNHSAYSAAHPDEMVGLSAHNETPGRSGFTGRRPSDRCAAVGASCDGEVMSGPVADPVGGWLATVYHRFLPGSPQAGIVGGGRADGGEFVMNSGADQNLLIEPFGYPVGRWRGEKGFGGEIPDPLDACHKSGQAIAYPVGIAVTLFIPKQAGTVESIRVRRHGQSRALPGCLLTGGSRGAASFVLDDPLVARETYDVHGEWNPGPDGLPGGIQIPGPTLSHEWSFTFQPDGYGRQKRSRRCRAVIMRRFEARTQQRPGSRRGRKKGLQGKLFLSHPAKVRLRRASLFMPGKKGGRRKAGLPLGKLRGRSLRVGRRSLLTFRLPRGVGRRLPLGEKVVLRVAFSAQRSSSCTRRKTFSLSAATRVGWVHMKTPATWRSGRRRR